MTDNVEEIILEQEVANTLNEELKQTKKTVGRPKIYLTEDAKKASYNKYMREYFKNKRREHKELKIDVSNYTGETVDILTKMKELIKKKNKKIDTLEDNLRDMCNHYSNIIKELVAENQKFKHMNK